MSRWESPGWFTFSLAPGAEHEIEGEQGLPHGALGFPG